jgi:hypothetical protein
MEPVEYRSAWRKITILAAPIASRYKEGEGILKYLLFTIEDVNKLY